MLSGSLQVKNKKYYAVLSIKDSDGKFKTKWVSLNVPAEKGNKRKAEAELKRVIDEYSERSSVDYKDVLFCDYLRQWLEGYKGNIEEVSYESYKNFLDKHLYPYYRSINVKLFDLKPAHIQTYYSQKSTADEEALSANTLRKHHAVVRKCLQHALQMNMILFNPADRVTLPRIDRYRGRAYTLEQAQQLLEACKGDVLETPIILALQFGLRRSEALGLKWNAVDFENNCIIIRHTVVRLNTRIEKDRTKNKSSARTLPMLGESRKYFMELKAKQEEEKKLCGADYTDTDYVCRWPNGKPYDASIISHNFPRFAKKLGLPVYRYHDLRHSAASILVSLGFNVLDISRFLGHNQVSTTLDIYAHLFNSSSESTTAFWPVKTRRKPIFRKFLDGKPKLTQAQECENPANSHVCGV